MVESSERKRTISISSTLIHLFLSTVSELTFSEPSSSPTRKKVKPALKSDSSDSDIICLNDQQDSPEILLQKMKDLVASCKNLSNFTRETYRQSKHVLEKVQALVDKQEDDIEAEQI